MTKEIFDNKNNNNQNINNEVEINNNKGVVNMNKFEEVLDMFKEAAEKNKNKEVDNTNKYEEKIEMLKNEYYAIVTYKFVEEELSNPSEEVLELSNQSEELIELLTKKAIEKISNAEPDFEADREGFIWDMVEGAIDNIMGLEPRK